MYDIIKNPKNISWKNKLPLYKIWLSKNFYYDWAEPQYKNIKPILYGVELLIDCNGNEVIDYKFHCINGNIEFIHVASDRTGNTKRN